MEDLEILNNKKLFLEITRMRDVVQRARVSASRKLLRKVNELQRKKGNKKEKTRNALKVERLMNEMKEIKKIRADSVTKFALVNSMENYLEYIKDEETPAFIKGMARIACEKAITTKLTQIQQKYENWDDVQAVLQVTKKVKKKMKKKEKKNEELNKISDTETPNLEFKSSGDETSSGPDEPPVDDFEDNLENDLEQTSAIDLEQTSAIDVEQTSAIDLEQTSAIDLEQTSESKVSKLKPQEMVKKTTKPQQEQTKDVKDLNVKRTAKTVAVPIPEQNKEPTKSSSIAVVRRLANLEELETMEQDATNTPTSASDNLKKSSFFLSADGEEVESDVDDAISSSESEIFENDDAAVPGFNKVYHSRGRDMNQSGGQRQLPRLGALNNRDQHNPRKWKDCSTKKENQPSRPQHSALPNKHTNQGPSVPLKPEETKKLHPSWEAKKKLRESVQIDFKPLNKKIKFD